MMVPVDGTMVVSWAGKGWEVTERAELNRLPQGAIVRGMCVSALVLPADVLRFVAGERVDATARGIKVTLIKVHP